METGRFLWGGRLEGVGETVQGRDGWGREEEERKAQNGVPTVPINEISTDFLIVSRSIFVDDGQTCPDHRANQDDRINSS